MYAGWNIFRRGDIPGTGDVDDRNLISHTYNEELTISIYERLDEYVGLLTLWLERIEKNYQINELN